MKLLTIVIIFFISTYISYRLSKKTKVRYNKFICFSDNINAEINSIKNSELKELRESVDNLSSQSKNIHSLSELIELSSKIRYSKKRVKRYYDPYSDVIVELPELKHTRIVDSENDIEINSYDLERLISEKVANQKSSGKTIPFKRTA
jgi:hypothetical protein